MSDSEVIDAFVEHLLDNFANAVEAIMQFAETPEDFKLKALEFLGQALKETND
ncbi:hypothetical protein [Arthrobacter sp. 31Y]|uniref:hypothetical protein n=1 Tax=Arthrobacter sp. 31Y TaxID=1115632 RepID=UPI0004B3D18E|nr:hypothetical protein [Arthrobacter sp. 31Y]